jgi:hypothetical protein
MEATDRPKHEAGEIEFDAEAGDGESIQHRRTQ